MNKTFWFPYKPQTVVDAINKYAVATGSPQYAQQGEFADYNGKYVRMVFNDRRHYWIAEYTWAGRNVIARGTFEDVFFAAVSFHKNDGKGGALVVDCQTDEQAKACEAAGMVPWSEDAASAHYDSYAWWGSEVSNAFSLDKWMGLGAVHMLATSKSLEEYKSKLDAETKRRTEEKHGSEVS